MKASEVRAWINREISAAGDFEILLPNGEPMQTIEMLPPLPDPRKTLDNIIAAALARAPRLAPNGRKLRPLKQDRLELHAAEMRARKKPRRPAAAHPWKAAPFSPQQRDQAIMEEFHRLEH